MLVRYAMLEFNTRYVENCTTFNMEHLKENPVAGQSPSISSSMHRLGFSIRVMGASDLTSWQPSHGNPLALGIKLMHLRDIIQHCASRQIHMYRMHCGLAPHISTGGELCGLWRTYQGEADLLSQLVHENDVRLSFHPYSLVNLSAPDEERASRSIIHLESQAVMLDALGLSPEAVIVLHVGGVYDDIGVACERFCRRYEALPAYVRKRVVLENDDRRFSVAEILDIHNRCGVPLVFDWQHHQVLNPSRLSWQEALRSCLASWPACTTPKIHFSSPRTELRSESGRIKVPAWTEHSDYVQPFEFIAFIRASMPLSFDIMLECKARDLALLKLRQDLKRFAPDLAARFR